MLSLLDRRARWLRGACRQRGLTAGAGLVVAVGVMVLVTALLVLLVVADGRQAIPPLSVSPLVVVPPIVAPGRLGLVVVSWPEWLLIGLGSAALAAAISLAACGRRGRM